MGASLEGQHGPLLWEAETHRAIRNQGTNNLSGVCQTGLVSFLLASLENGQNHTHPHTHTTRTHTARTQCEAGGHHRHHSNVPAKYAPQKEDIKYHTNIKYHTTRMHPVCKSHTKTKAQCLNVRISGFLHDWNKCFSRELVRLDSKPRQHVWSKCQPLEFRIHINGIDPTPIRAQKNTMPLKPNSVNAETHVWYAQRPLNYTSLTCLVAQNNSY